MAADGLTKSEIARRLGVNRRTAARLVEAIEPPRYSRAPAGSMLDPLEGVLRRLIEECADIRAPRVTEILRDDYGYSGSVDLVRKRLAVLRPRAERPAQRTGYRPGQVLQVSNCQELWMTGFEDGQAATFSSGVCGCSSGARIPSLKVAPARTSVTSSWPLKRRQRSWAASSSL